MNNPIYITKEDFEIWNSILQTDSKQSNPVYMSPNYRPLKPVNKRLLRTNIRLSTIDSEICKGSTFPDISYKSNPRRKEKH